MLDARKPPGTFRIICQGIIGALDVLGVRAEFKPVNDVLVGGRKISGSAQIRRHGVVLQHGTLLVRTDYERMFSVLRSNKRSRDSMTSLAEELSDLPPVGTIKKAMQRGFAEALDVDMETGGLSERECMLADEMVHARYGLREHINLY